MIPQDTIRALRNPIDGDAILRRRKALRRELLAQSRARLKKRIAILGGSTTSEIRHVLDLFLLDSGIEAEFFECDYAKYYECAVFGDQKLEAFRPDAVYLHTTSHNVSAFPDFTDNAEAAAERVAAEAAKYGQIWRALRERFACSIIQNNFEFPPYRRLGNLDGIDHRGRTWFIDRFNARLADLAREVPSVHLHDLHYLASWYGLERWHDASAWHSYKYALSYGAIPHLARSLTSLLLSVFGLAKKCLVLDLDNTLWGGVIGDDGVDHIQLGQGSPVGEAHLALQEYIADLGRRGVALAVCSKNEPTAAQEGLTHPDSALRLSDFAAFKANWEPKHINIQNIATELNLGIDSLVFLDDNPAERELVASECPEVVVPDIGSDVARYLEFLDQGGWFEPLTIAQEDLLRNTMYQGNAQRNQLQNQARSYDDFLRSLDMVAEIGPFKPLYLDRITQLINKTNQFNLTTRRYSLAQVQDFSTNPRFITLYGRLKDKFGDNGLISVLIGEQRGGEVHIDSWLMSCRVLKRDMEVAMLDALTAECRRRDVTEVFGYYYPTKKNGLVSSLFSTLGFTLVSETPEGSVWWLAVQDERKNRIIQVNP